jgi:hypothetical protein
MADILGAVGNALGLTNSSSLQKLRIESWDKIQRSGPADAANIFNAFINPDEFTVNYNVHVDNTAQPGTNSKLGQQLGIAPLEVTLKLLLDGTGITGSSCDVPEQIKQFYKTVGYDEKGTKHNIRFLRIIWGNLTLLRSNQFALDCILKNASLQYKMFKPNGTPLRVLVTATFTEALSDDIIASEFPKNSPDLTHVRIVKEGDTLPAMVYTIYGDFTHYMEVAKTNGLTDFRNLEPGQKIFFPPFDKNVKKKINA